jgi:hypothetical protein
MIIYFIILIVTICLIYLARNNIVEPLSPLVNYPYSPGIQLTRDSIYLTENRLNYDVIDREIESIELQRNELKENLESFKMNVGFVEETLQHIPSTVRVGGGFPHDINLNFSFPPPFPGDPGPDGDKGDDGEKGKHGLKGQIGFIGGNNYC